MKKVDVFEGKTHFSALIQQASQGETILVIKDGRPVAKIVPVDAVDEQGEAESAMDRIRANRVSLGPDLTIRELIDEGRRY